MSLELEQFQQEFTKEGFIKPFAQVFDKSAYNFKKNSSIIESLDVIFPEQKRQDKDLVNTKEVLGELSKSFTDLQLKELITDIDFLVENWLDQFEKGIFEGKTLKELLHEKGGL
ncbi:MAG: hypothetical protein PHS06_01235 [Candidatus Shapirobacteria bacterium]|nr:hypothetical protein [Candidatus Shapirobacteria bacterium]